MQAPPTGSDQKPCMNLLFTQQKRKVYQGLLYTGE